MNLRFRFILWHLKFVIIHCSLIPIHQESGVYICHLKFDIAFGIWDFRFIIWNLRWILKFQISDASLEIWNLKFQVTLEALNSTSKRSPLGCVLMWMGWLRCKPIRVCYTNHQLIVLPAQTTPATSLLRLMWALLFQTTEQWGLEIVLPPMLDHLAAKKPRIHPLLPILVRCSFSNPGDSSE